MSLIGWLKSKETTNFDMLVGLTSLLITCVAAGIICFYLGVKHACRGMSYDYYTESSCVVYNIDRIMSSGKE